MSEEKDTYRGCEKASCLRKGDIYYVRKYVGGYSEYWECKFVSLKGNIITGTILRHNWNGNRYEVPYSKGLLTARVTNCFLHGKGKNDKYSITHWLV